jgi:hypothetical protein
LREQDPLASPAPGAAVWRLAQIGCLSSFNLDPPEVATGEEGDRASVGRPERRGGAGGALERPRSTLVHRPQPELRRTVALRDERDRPAVRGDGELGPHNRVDELAASRRLDLETKRFLGRGLWREQPAEGEHQDRNESTGGEPRRDAAQRPRSWRAARRCSVIRPTEGGRRVAGGVPPECRVALEAGIDQ